MIVVKLEGGHSNQLFQYAAGRRLAHNLGVELFMDKYWFGTVADVDTPRFYELGDYHFKQNFISRVGFALVEDKPETLKVKLYKLTKGRSKPRLTHYRQRGHSFNDEVLNLTDNTYLEGWWQDENYFKDIRPILLDELELKNKPSKKNADYLSLIKNSDSVSIHVRRGDYIDNPEANKFHGVLDIGYYEKSIKTLATRTGQNNFKLFVFSNDINWCKKNLKLGFPTIFVEGNKKGSEDMRLMKHCRHNIMANSSFSWWGAWLNQNPDKIVIAPKAWFQDKQANKETKIIPELWVRL